MKPFLGDSKTYKINMLRKLFSIAILFMLVIVAKAQVRKYSNEFLNIGVGARSLGMANANVASVNDVSSGYWNPAGLLGMKNDLQVSLMHAEYFAGIAKYDYASFAVQLDTTSAMGLSLIRFGVDNIPNTTELIDGNGNINYDRITSFSAADYGFLFSYAKKTNVEGLHFGANAKVIHRLVGGFAKAWGFGLDAGLQYKRGFWNYGLMAKDITSTFNAWSFNLSDRMKEVFMLTSNQIPDNSLEITLPKLILGASRKINIKNNYYIQPELNCDFTFDGKRNVLLKSNLVSIDPKLGAEFGFYDFAFFRAGIGNFQKYSNENGVQSFAFQPNMGIGIKIKKISIDYALTDIGDKSVALYSNVFSLRYDINKQKR